MTSASRKRLAVVVVNYRTAAMTLDCLTSLEAQIDPARDVVALVDNASADGSAEKLAAAVTQRGWQTWVRLIEADANRGFGAGNNIALRAVDADYYLLLNSDTLVQPGALSSLLRTANREPSVGLWGPRLEGVDGSVQVSCFRNHSPISELIDAAATGPITRLLAPFDVPLRNADARSRPGWVSFACVLVRRQVFQQIGLLDEGYFMYFEDADVCRRACRAGWGIRYCPEARVVHLVGGSSAVDACTAARQRLPEYYYRSRTRYYAKFYSRPGLLAANVLWLTGRSIAWLREPLGNKRPHARACAARDIWSGFRRPRQPWLAAARAAEGEGAP